jgi:protein SCO1/2
MAVVMLASLGAFPILAAEQKVMTLDPARNIGFDQKLGASLPLDATFRDETGATVTLGSYFKDKPVILSLAYYRCPMLCGLALQGLASSLKPLQFSIGREFEVVTVSFDPRETPELAKEKKEGFIELYGRPGAERGWHFLTGDAESIRRLTEAVGFRYAWDVETQDYAHATGVILITPDGRVSRYFFGVDYAAKDLRLGLIETAGNTIGTLADRLLLLCYQYDPHTGRYSATALVLVRVASILSALGLAAFVLIMIRRERRERVA